MCWRGGPPLGVSDDISDKVEVDSDREEEVFDVLLL